MNELEDIVYKSTFRLVGKFEGKKLCLAFSGGSDSTALFFVLLSLRQKCNFSLSVLHVNYNLRGEDSKEDERFVRSLAEENGVKYFVRRIREGAFEGKNTQVYARKIRYSFFNKIKKDGGFNYLITAHNSLDNAETVLYRLVKGSGIYGLRGIPKRRGYIIRPMLDASKEIILKYLLDNNLAYRKDLSNEKNIYSRNLIRNKVLPLLNKISPKASDNINYISQNASNAYALYKIKVDKALKESFDFTTNSYCVDKLKKYSSPLRKEVLASILRKEKVHLSRTRIGEIEKIIFSDKPNITSLWESSVAVVKEYGFLRIEKNYKENSFEKIVFKETGKIETSLGEVVIEKIKYSESLNLKDGSLYFDAKKIAFPILVRSREEGDIIKAYPSGQSVKLKKLFINKKISPTFRRDALVVCSNNKIIGVYLSHLNTNNVCSTHSFVSESSLEVIRIRLKYR